MALTITPKIEGMTLTLELNGKLSAMEAKEFDEKFKELSQDMKEALLEFSGVSYISSAGLRSVYVATKLMMQQGGELKVLYPTAEVMEVFDVTHSDNFVTIVRKKAEDTTVFYPLRPVQRMMIDLHFQRAKSTMMNTGALIRLDDSLDLELLAEALNGLLSAYDIFRCRLVLHPGTGELCQRFDGEVEKIYVETMSDESFEERKQSVKQPYELIDHPLYRIYIMKTNSVSYFYVDFYHAVMDGTAIVLLFWRELDKRYMQLVNKQEPKSLRQPSSYAEYIMEEARIPQEELKEGRDYWREILERFDAARHLPPPDVQGEPETMEHEIEVPFPGMEKSFFRGKDFSENTFFMAAAMLALAKTAGSNEAVLGWVHNGRVTSSERRLMGLMLDQYPTYMDFSRDCSAHELLCTLEANVLKGMELRKSLSVFYEESCADGIAGFILQKGSMGRRGTLKLGGKENFIEEMPANEISAAENTLDIEMNSHDDGSYSLVLDYDNHLYTEGAMRNFAAVMEKMTTGLQDGERMVSELLSDGK